MPNSMTSKERILAALALQEPDRVPIAMRGLEPLNHLWKDKFDRAIVLRDRFGIDDFPVVSSLWIYKSSVEEKTEWKTYGDQEYPLLCTDYHTPAGVLHAEVFMSDGYHTDRLNLAVDQVMPRMVERTIKDRADVEKFKYLLAEPSECDLRAWDENMRRHVEFGREEDFPIGFYIPHVSGIAMKNVGAMEIVMRAMDGDPMVEELLTALTDWAARWLEYGVGFDPDIIYFSGVYESTDFWSPALFRRLFAPMHKRLAEQAHAHGKKYINYITTGVDGLLEEFTGLGIDALYGWDSTPPGDVDIYRLRQVLGDEMAFWGGISPTFVVERGTEEEVRADVRKHIEVLAPGGGYILSTGGSVYFAEQAGLGGVTKWDGVPEESRSYRNLMVMFEAGLEYGKYPLNL